jgi:hypothetical protein
MVGSLGPLSLNAAAFGEKLRDPATGAAMAEVGLESYEALRDWYTAGPAQMRSFVGPGPLLTDDLPLVEYYRSLPRDTEALDLQRLRGDVADIEPR